MGKEESHHNCGCGGCPGDGTGRGRGNGFADAGSTTTTTTANTTQPANTLLARVATILGIDQSKLESAVTQAKTEMQTDALKNRLQTLVANGTITQDQADQYLKWWQSKPDMAPYQQQLNNWMQSRPTVPPDLKNWQQSKPNIPMPGGLGGRGPRGMGRMGGL